jgi:two-component system response regulator YesN
MKVLIAEDEKVTLQGIVSNIPWKEYGIDDVFKATDGIEAFSIAVRNKVDIVISDIRMPLLDGISLINRLRGILCCQFIIISAYSDKEYLKSAIKLHVFGYIEKPIYLPELRGVIKDVANTIRQGYQRNPPLNRENDWPSNLKGRGDYFLSPMTPEENPYIYSFIKTLIGKEQGSNQIQIEKCLKSIANRLQEDKKIDVTRSKIIFNKLIGIFFLFLKLNGIEVSREKASLLGSVDFTDTIDHFISHLTSFYMFSQEALKRIDKSDLLIAKVMLVLEYYYQNTELYIPFICDILSVSKSNICRLFKRQIGNTINETITKFRIEKACVLLKESSQSITEISAAVGFHDQNYFCRVFKQIFGVTPSSYREGSGYGD